MRISSLKAILKQRLCGFSTPADRPGDDGVVVVDGIGHRAYVGGLWESLGSLQFRFMVDNGLEPQHVFLDIACGSLRAGVRFIPYLEPGNYLGIDVKQELIDAGIKNELGQKLYNLKRPEFVVSETFEFSRFSKQPDFALAHALFIHLSDQQILLCLRNLRAIANAKARFYATFFESDEPRRTVLDHHPFIIISHTRGQMIEFGRLSGWDTRYIGNWGHPRGQIMIEYSAG